MTHATARSAALLAVILALLGRGLSTPGALAAAGGLGLAVYGALALGPALAQRLLEPAPAPAVPDPAGGAPVGAAPADTAPDDSEPN